MKSYRLVQNCYVSSKIHNNKKATDIILRKYKIINKTGFFLDDVFEVKTNIIWDKLENSVGIIDHNKNISIDYRYTLNDNIKALIHETIHLKQMVDGHLYFDSINNEVIWKNVRYEYSCPEKMTREEYSSLPWEIDVRYKESYYYYLVIKHIGNNNE